MKKLATDPLSLDFGRDKPFCVYIYFDPRPGKRRAPIYVGMGQTKTRPDTHWRSHTYNALLAVALAGIKSAGMEPIVEFAGFFDAKEQALALEGALIRKFKRLGTLCNIQGVKPIVRRPRSAPRGSSSYPHGTATPEQVRGARQMLGCTHRKLAEMAGVPLSSVQSFEAGKDIRLSAAPAIENALSRAGILFLDPGAARAGGRGLRFRQQ